jgi:DNA-binding SARP family transcriptional activator
MRYEILGPIRVIGGEHGSVIGARKVETLLAVLLASADRVVSIDSLAEEIWGEGRPRRAMAGIHVYVSQIRKFLAREGRPDNPLVTRPPGYYLSLGSDELDYRLFQDLVVKGRGQVRDGLDAEAVNTFDFALSLWRGPALGDICDGPILSGFVNVMTEARLECQEMFVEAHLRLGRHREVIGLLNSLTRDHPLREAFYRQLMLALYRSERQAEALAVFRLARWHLREELGLEPCRSLQEIHRSILAADEDLFAIA